MLVVLGVDGGGTTTRCVCVDAATQRILGRGYAGSSNYHSVGAETAQNNLRSSFQQALDQALSAVSEFGEENVTVKAVGLTLSGVDRPKDFTLVKQWMSEMPFYSTEIVVTIHNDAIGALASGTGGHLEGNCVIIAGTGAIALGVKADGTSVRTAGWGPLLCDGGSGYHIGQLALTAAAKAADCRGPPTALLDAILKFLELAEPMDLIPWAYGIQGWAHIASLCPTVIECAEAGDQVAEDIIQLGVDELCGSVKALADKMAPPPPPSGDEGIITANVGCSASPEFTLVLSGSLLEPGRHIGERLVKQLAKESPHARPVHSTVEPAMGGAFIALKQIENDTDLIKEELLEPHG